MHKHHGRYTGKVVTSTVRTASGESSLETFVPWTVVRPQPATISAPYLIEERKDPGIQEGRKERESALLRALGLSHHWKQLLDREKLESVAEIAAREGVDITQIRRLMRLTLLAPSVIEKLMAHPVGLDAVLSLRWPAQWSHQLETLEGLEGRVR